MIKPHSLQIPEAEYTLRNLKLSQLMIDHSLQGVVLFDATNILYFSGFAFIPTERPIMYAISASGERAMFVPRLEVEHVKQVVNPDRIGFYQEYPGIERPEVAFKQLLAAMGMLVQNGRLGADHNGYPWLFGYEGPTLAALADTAVVNIQSDLNQIQAIKSEAELNLIRESCKWGHLAHQLLQKYTAVGKTETEVSLQASHDATIAMMDAIGPLYRASSMWSSGPSAGYRGQIGRNAAIPHALANNIRFQKGDVLVTGAGCPMWGYNSELERTMFVGEPSTEQKTLFAHMMAAQEIAFETLRPGATCAEVDRAVRNYYDQHGLMQHWKHHTGHAIGLRYHEGPFLDLGDQTMLQEGMVFTIEPGFYDEHLGGYRHSDTVAISGDGIEMLTYYPRHWEALVIE